MRAENIGIYNKKHFWCGALDTRTLRITEVHKIEECEAVDWNSYWIFKSDPNAEELLENFVWIFFWVEKSNGKVKVQLQIETETMKPNAQQIIYFEGLKSIIKRQINIK